MKYFTPDLYVRMQSRDSDLADRADDDWDRAVKAYASRREFFRAKAPESVKYLADCLNLHDAEFVDMLESPECVLILAREYRTLYMLDYHPTAAVETSAPYDSPVFTPYGARFLYDEIDVECPRNYSHAILLTDGRVLRVRFDRVEVYELHPRGTISKLRAAEAMLEVAYRISKKHSPKGGQGQVTVSPEDVQTIKRAIQEFTYHNSLSEQELFAGIRHAAKVSRRNRG